MTARHLVLLLTLALWPAFPSAQPAGRVLAVAVDRQASVAATAGLETFRALVKAQSNFREMGFESAKELDLATLGEPYATYLVRLDELGAFKAGADPLKLLHGTQELVFPVLVDGRVRSSLTVRPAEKGWMASGFGAPNKAALATRIRADVARAADVAPASLVLVEVPAMKLVFIGQGSGGALLLTPLLDSPAFGLKAGVAEKADDVFGRLAPATRAFREVPG